MKRIGVVTSGGDAPGMNAAIRAVVRLAYAKNFQVLGFERGWEGLITDSLQELTPRSVGGIIHTGGTILHTSRCPEFRERKNVIKAAETLDSNDVYGLVVIGGDGSFDGALELSQETDTLLVGIPATIDNDVYGTDETIGFDTAVDTAVTAIDKIRDTAVSHQRVFIVEVMGRRRGFLASMIGLTVGAEIILVPEVETEEEYIFKTLKKSAAKGKKSAIIVAAEGIGDTHKLAQKIEENTESEVRRSILGYAQRGGNPSARSRLLANLFAEKAIELLSEGKGNRTVGLQDGNIVSTELEKTCKNQKPLDLELLQLARTLAK
ncbi:6-phosphofructokinase [Candidatus Bathyarchaeota archaeon]|nr:6-phosphofructokinase [Candidatus Bathyarchaeota archaeon]NIU81111.1 6-phosphofructokinase [Candidatus Bathyarchaeota archaeon]NIV68127.1 6-phosphofructokinase [Candidatus Bathyarchaeota archaeon]NIW16223.1 6-phosphofructokinase [Candidatus Bathyarchaeota archaeon]NIW34344.1 6-phosphofructokinase [Candidatus Bathyarchaeota archaeon]